jgi:type IV pilus secretin PilQ/predicted competence protein
MAGMKTRFAGIRNFASIRTKGASLGALLVSLAFTVPGIGYAEQKVDRARIVQPQSVPVPLPKNSSPGNAVKELPSGKTAGATTKAFLKNVSFQSEASQVTVAITTDRPVTPQEFKVENPARLVLDFPNTINDVQFMRLPVHAGLVKRVRVQQYQGNPNPIARVVLDLEEGNETHETKTDKDSVRLIFQKTKPEPIPAKPVRTAEPGIKSSFIPTASAAPVEKNSVKTAPSSGISTPKPAAPPAPSSVPPASSNVPNAVVKSESVKPAPTVKQASAPVEKASAKAVPTPNVSTSKPATPVAPAPVASPSSNVTNAAVKAEPAKPAPFVVPVLAQAPSKPAVIVEMPPTPQKNDSPKEVASIESRQLAAPPPTPLVAALTASTTAPLRAMQSGNSRFSGQPLTLDLIDIPLVDFFRLMSEEGGINIVMDPEIKGRVSIKVVKVPWDQIFDAVLTNNGLDKQVEGTVVRIAKKATLQDEAKLQESLKKANLLAADLETRIKRLNYAKATTLLKALEDQKTVRGTIVVEERTNSLILTDIPSSITKLVQLIETLDVPQPQVEIEARIVSATRDFARDIGIQFGFVDGNLQRVTVGGPNTFGTIGGTRPSATPTSTYAAGTSTGRGASEGTATESAAVSTGTSSNNKGNYNVNLPATKAFGGIGISIGNIFDTFLLDAAITAGESKGLAKLISQPKVTAQNNSSAVITQGLRFPVQIIANNTITVQFQNAALTLTVTPQITYEGNIVLDLKVENNTPDFSRQVNGIPSISISESTTRVLVSDGGTTVIGGILIDNESTQEDKVPGLGSLPVVGNLFRRNSVSRSTQEVLFFVTPRIVK